ncbi:hypothetical protein BSKO_05161 [Bryopsis sp. KO-2023]|nr:hypothetical protein BSKO_05161 [Bryopsis sp. KO-2023]
MVMLLRAPALAALGATTGLPNRQPIRPSLGVNRRPLFRGFCPPIETAKEVVCDAAVGESGISIGQPGVLAPADTYKKIVELGEMKGKLSPMKTFIMAIVAGVFISFGALLALSVGFSCPGMVESNPGAQKILLGLFGLPFGLFLVINCGVELFTGNTAFLTASVLEGKSSVAQLGKSWFFSYFGNLAGCLLTVWTINACGLSATADPAMAVATAKTSLTFMQAFLRGILANWLVCIGAWMAYASSSMPGKVLGIFLPISSFVAMGFEHSVANMFFIPFGINFGAAGLTFASFCTTNLIPVTLGNIVGGAFCLATLSSLFYGKLGENI